MSYFSYNRRSDVFQAPRIVTGLPLFRTIIKMCILKLVLNLSLYIYKNKDISFY